MATTKTKKEIRKEQAIKANELLKTWEDLPEIYVTSAEKKEGGDEILKFIGETNAFLQNNKVNFQ